MDLERRTIIPYFNTGGTYQPAVTVIQEINSTITELIDSEPKWETKLIGELMITNNQAGHLVDTILNKALILATDGSMVSSSTTFEWIFADKDLMKLYNHAVGGRMDIKHRYTEQKCWEY